MKGTLYKTEEGWFVGNAKHSELPLHPDNVKICNQYGDYSIDWDSKEVEFEIVTENYEDDKGCTYAKLINHPVEPNEMIDHIGDANKMVCMFEPRTDTSSATICKHCGKEKFLHDHVPDVGKMVEEYGATVNQLYKEWLKIGFEAGYTKAKETLYTEEQVREVIRNCFKSNAMGFLVTEDDMIRTIKQPKQ